MYDSRGTAAPWYRGWDLSAEERATFRATTLAAQKAKRQALSGEGGEPAHPVYVPRLDPLTLMPRLSGNGFKTLSLFSGGGGLDIGFDRAGFSHVANYEILTKAANVLRTAKPSWNVFGGADGDVTRVDWSIYRGKIDVLHGGPPCQPFSLAGRRAGSNDVRDMIPEFVRAVKIVEPRVFVCENVIGLTSKKFENYLNSSLLNPLKDTYKISIFHMDAADFGVPQRRKRVFFVGFNSLELARSFKQPVPTHCHARFSGGARSESLPVTMGSREALGLPMDKIDDLAPTIRSGLTGPRHTTSVLSSVSAQRVWGALGIWPNGVSMTREMASAYVAKDGHFRLSVPDCMILQGFPNDWPIDRPVYMALGLIGNSVAPPMGYHLAKAVAGALKKSNFA